MLASRGGLRACLTAFACAGAAALATSGTAGAGTTPASTFEKSGRDSTSGSTATSGGTVGTTAAGRTIDWTLHYRNTTGVQADVELSDVIAGNQTFVPGSLRLPPGLTGRWSTNGGSTFSASEPASGVDAVGATGTNVDGSTGRAVAVQPAQSGFNVGNVGGDGWEALFVDDNVYNVHHHRAPGAGTLIDCHVKATGATCPGFPVGGTYVSENDGDAIGTGGDTLTTPQAPNGFADASTGRIWFPAGRTNQTSIGVACIDVRALQSCGYTELGTAAFPSAGGQAQINGGGAIGARYYLIDGEGEIHCFDTSTQTACAGLAAPAGVAPSNANTVVGSQVEVFDDRYVFANLAESDSSRDLLCLDTTTGAACAGFPILGYGGVYLAGGQHNQPIAPTLSTTGVVTGICGPTATDNASAPWNCLDLTGAPVPTPWTQRVANTTVNWISFGSILRIDTKLYFAQTNNTTLATTYTCWDFAIDASCAGFVQSSSGANVRPYTLRQDPTAPDCIWVVGDAGVFETFSATFGGTRCTLSQSVVDIDPSEYYCDGPSGHVSGWRTLRIGGVDPAGYSGLAVTIAGIDGTTVPGWDNRVFASNEQTIDISAIPISGNTARLRVTVSFNDLDPAATATATASFDGDPAQVCFSTRVGAAQCTATPVSNAARVVTAAPAGISDAPAGNASGAATFRVADDTSLCAPFSGSQAAGADLEIVKRVNRRVVIANAPLTWTATVTNRGPGAAGGVVLLDEPSLPVAFTFVHSASGTCAKGPPVRCELGTLAPGATVTVTLIGRARTAGVLRNTVRVSGDGGDPQASDNVASVTTTVRGRVALRKTADRRSVAAGGRVGYRIRVTNPTAISLANVRVCDRLPAGLAFVRSSPRAVRSGGRYCWSVGTLAPHASRTLRIVTRSLAGAGGALTNTATATARGALAQTARRVVRVLGRSTRGGGVTG